MKPIYPEKLPPQIAKPYSLLLQGLKGIPIEKKEPSREDTIAGESKPPEIRVQNEQKQTCLTQWL